MAYSPVPATPGMFRHFLAPAAAVCLGIGALMGLGSVVYLADPGYLAAVSEKLIISGIRSASARNTWLWVHILVSLVCTFGPALVVGCMIPAFRGQAARGMNPLSTVSHWLWISLRVLGWILVGIFCVRFGLYLLNLLHRQDWPYQLMATVLMEAMCLAIAVFGYRLLCRLLEEAEGCAASIGYTLSAGILSPGSIPAFVATGLTILGCIGLVLAADRLVTMTITSDGFQQYYTFLWSTHPGILLCAGSLFFGALGDFFLAGYLRFFKRTSERALFFATRNK